MKSLIKSIVAKTPNRIIRPGKFNRFAVIEKALESLRRRGFAPRHVIDAGANVGAFASFALNLLPAATVHPIESQPGCQNSLARVRDQSGGRPLTHPVALGAADQDGTVLPLLTDAQSTSTGVLIVSHELGDRAIKVPSITLDYLMAGGNAPAKGDEARPPRLRIAGIGGGRPWSVAMSF